MITQGPGPQDSRSLIGCLTVLGDATRRACPVGQTGYSQPIPKAGIGGSPRFAARPPIGIFGGLRAGCHCFRRRRGRWVCREAMKVQVLLASQWLDATASTSPRWIADREIG